MDNIDLSILKCLKDNSRQTASTISQTINLSVSAVIERIRKMEAKGVIQQYTVVLDEKQLGNDLTVFISVRLEHPKYGKEFAGSGLRP
ncbi:MAG: winged helix-turn-helix transcriptional regulator [Anaerosacchariphilus sp.]